MISSVDAYSCGYFGLVPEHSGQRSSKKNHRTFWRNVSEIFITYAEAAIY